MFELKNNKKMTKSEKKANKQSGTEKKLMKTKKKGKPDNIKKTLDKYKDDPMFTEFLDVHLKRQTKKIWNDGHIDLKENAVNKESENETSSNEEQENSKNESDNDSEQKNKEAVNTLSDKEYMELLKNKEKKSVADVKVPEVKTKDPKKLFTAKIRGLGYSHGKSDIKKFFKPIKCDSIRVPRKVKGIAYVGFATEKKLKQALNKDRTFLDGKRIFVFKFEGASKLDQKEQESHDQTDPKWIKSGEPADGLESIKESGKIFIRNLPYTATETDIKQLFEEYGPLSEFHLPIDNNTEKHKGFCILTFQTPKDAVKAYEKLHGSEFQGRNIYLHAGQEKNTESKQEGSQKNQKEKSNNDPWNHWSILFLGYKSVTAAIAETYNVSVYKISEEGVDGKSLADLVALSETQFVKDAQNFLEENGVTPTVFNEQSNSMSETVILVKNLPNDTRSEELCETFSKYGDLGRVVIPPFGITALVEYINPLEAKEAFYKLSYSRFKSVALYLEWAPADSFSVPYDPSKIVVCCKKEKSKNQEEKDIKEEKENNKKRKNTEDKKAKRIKTETATETGELSANNVKLELNEECEPEDDATLFVKNINFLTTEKKLRKHFSKCGRLHSVNIATRVDDDNPNETLSKGFGFVTYKCKADAMRALDELQDTELDGKTLELMVSNKRSTTNVKISKKTNKGSLETGTKIMVRNVAFQAQENELQQIFEPFGELVAVRLPKKSVDNETHRGFAFIEYSSKKDAKKAFKALNGETYLHDRRLLLEWAQENADKTKQKPGMKNKKK